MAEAIQIPEGKRLPTYAELARTLLKVGQQKSEWAGFPIPVDGRPLITEPRYPYQFNACKTDEGVTKGKDLELVNQWWDRRLNAYVLVIRENGRIVCGYRPVGSGVTIALNTMECAHVWLEEAEFKAMSKLEELVGEWRSRCYFLTGSFVERSKRSGVCYLFRRLRPTIAFRGDKILCALCLHPIGFYSSSYAGAMVPTDDVIAHLCMVRGDEPKFWANANQHSITRPEAGI